MLKIPSRIRWVEDGESSSAYFCRLEKKHSSDHWFSAIRNSDGSFTSDLQGIVDGWSSFYKDLFTYSSVNSTVQDEMLDNLESRLSQSKAMQCEGYLLVWMACLWNFTSNSGTLLVLISFWF